MSISFAVGSAPATSINAFGTGTGSLTINSVPLGASIIVAMQWGTSAATVSSVTCTGESNLTSCGARYYDATNNQGFQFFRLVGNVTVSGNKTITVTLAGGASGDLIVFPLRGCDTSDPFDSTAGFQTNTVASATNAPLSFTTNVANSAIISFAGNGFGGEPAADSTYTLMNGFTYPNVYVSGEYKLDVGAIGTYSNAMAAASSGRAQSAGIVVKAAPGSGDTLMGQAWM